MIPHARMFREIRSVHAVFSSAQIDVDEPLDLVAAALEEDDPQMEQARLATRGFRHGHTIRWVADHVVLSLTVHELGSPSEALLSVADHRETFRAAAANLETVSVDVVSGYIVDGDETIQLHSSATGPFHVTVAARFSSEAVTEPAAVAAIASQQRVLLA